MAGRVSPFWWILRFRLRALGRALGRHAFTVLVIGPMIVVGFALILEPSVERAAGWLRGAAADWDGKEIIAAALLATGLLVASGLSSAINELFAVRSSDGYLDALPVRPTVLINHAIVAQVIRAVPIGAVLGAVTLALSDSTSSFALPLSVTVAFLVVQLALAQLIFGLAFVHWGWFKRERSIMVAGALLLAVWLTSWNHAAAFLTGPLFPPAVFLGEALCDALGIWSPTRTIGIYWGSSRGLIAAAEFGQRLFWTLVLYKAVRTAYLRWRDEDREKAQASTQRRRLLAAWRGLAERRFGRAIGSLVLRDLRLTLRGFSPAVYVAGAAAALFELGALSAWLEGWLAPQWIGPFLLFCLSLACLSLSALAPLLLEHELPRMWMERSTGVAPTALWKAKNRLALILSAPALAATIALAIAIEPTALDAVFLAGRAFLVWVTVATVIGTLAFEIAPSPALGLLLGGVFAVGLSGLYALQDFWPIGLFLYAYVMHALSERADGTASVLGVEG